MDSVQKEAVLVEQSSNELSQSIQSKQESRPSTIMLNNLKNKKISNKRILSSNYKRLFKCGSHFRKFKRDIKRHKTLSLIEKIKRGEQICESDLGLEQPWHSHCSGVFHRFKESLRYINKTLILETKTYGVMKRILEGSSSQDKEKNESHLILKIVIFCSLPVFYFMVNLCLILYFFRQQRNKALRHIRIWGMDTFGPVFFFIYLFLGSSCCMWVFAFDYFKLYYKIYVPISEIRQYKRSFKVVLVGAFLNNLTLFSTALVYSFLTGFNTQPISIYMFLGFAGIATTVNLIFSFKIKTDDLENFKNVFVKKSKYNQASIAFCNINLGKKSDKSKKDKKDKKNKYVLLNNENENSDETNIFEQYEELDDKEDLFKNLLEVSKNSISSKAQSKKSSSTNKTKAFIDYLNSIKE